MSFVFGGVWAGLRTTCAGRMPGKEGWHCGFFVPLGQPASFPGALRHLLGEAAGDRAVAEGLRAFLAEASSDGLAAVLEVMSS